VVLRLDKGIAGPDYTKRFFTSALSRCETHNRFPGTIWLNDSRPFVQNIDRSCKNQPIGAGRIPFTNKPFQIVAIAFLGGNT